MNLPARPTLLATYDNGFSHPQLDYSWIAVRGLMVVIAQ
jgi:hypothetical protein